MSENKKYIDGSLKTVILECLINIVRYSYGEPIPYRFSNDAYVAKLLLPLRSVVDNVHNISFYHEPAKKFTGNKDPYNKLKFINIIN